MNILVFIKQVADTEARISIQADKKSLDVENKFTMNFFDEFAVEEAIRTKEKLKESQITVCSYGPKKAIEALRTAVAMGADKAVLIEDNGGIRSDPLAVARLLAAFGRSEPFDLIICGKQALDDENGLIGIMVAELLGIPHASNVISLEAGKENMIEVETEVEGGREWLEIQLPALITVQKGINSPRVPLITGVMKAMKATIPVVDPFSLAVDGGDVDLEHATTPVLYYEGKPERPEVKMIEGESAEEKVRTLVKLLQEEAKVL